jgi:hypothetical protein
MKAVHTTGLMALMALGVSAFLPDAVADLPQPGEYKGTLTIVRTIGGRTEGEPDVVSKTVYKATARVDAEGYVRIAYAGNEDPLFGQLNDETDTLTLRDQLITVEMTLKRLSFTIPDPPSEILGPFEQSVPLAVTATTKLTRVGK